MPTVACLLAFACLATFATGVAAPYRVDQLCTFPVISVAGSSHDVGFAVGQAFASRLSGYLQAEPLFNQVILPYYQTPIGKSVVSSWIANVERLLPRLDLEIRGLAEGLQMPLDLTYLLNMQDEVYQVQ